LERRFHQAWRPLLAAPLFVAGGVKIIHDLLLYRSFATSQGNIDAHSNQGT
jgi:hypothetical protein